MYSRARRAEALALLSDGWSLNRVSQQTGISRAAIREWRERGIDPHGWRPRGSCFRCDSHAVGDPAAYSGLLGYYLGDGSISQGRAAFSLRIFFDRRYPAIIDDVEDLIGRIHVGHPVGRVRAPGMFVVVGSWKHWPCLFPQHGPGRKHERKLALEPWQREIVEAHPWEDHLGLYSGRRRSTGRTHRPETLTATNHAS